MYGRIILDQNVLGLWSVRGKSPVFSGRPRMLPSFRGRVVSSSRIRSRRNILDPFYGGRFGMERRCFGRINRRMASSPRVEDSSLDDRVGNRTAGRNHQYDSFSMADPYDNGRLAEMVRLVTDGSSRALIRRVLVAENRHQAKTGF